MQPLSKFDLPTLRKGSIEERTQRLYAALAKRWKVQFRKGFAYFNNNVDSKRHIIIRTAILCNEINSGQIMKNTNNM